MMETVLLVLLGGWVVSTLIVLLLTLIAFIARGRA